MREIMKVAHGILDDVSEIGLSAAYEPIVTAHFLNHA
jgi:hypothetical protein